jgi:hypothetical protein
MSSALEVCEVGIDLAAGIGQVVTRGFRLPAAIARWVGPLAGRPNWVCAMAFSAATRAAARAVYVNSEYAWLGSV